MGCNVKKGTTDCAAENEAKIMLICGCMDACFKMLSVPVATKLKFLG